jgi:hypothetical protein
LAREFRIRIPSARSAASAAGFERQKRQNHELKADGSEDEQEPTTFQDGDQGDYQPHERRNVGQKERFMI